MDLGVGLWAWPLPMDIDHDGDLDLVVSCPDTPFNGTYWFENPGGSAFPVFKAPRRLDRGKGSVRLSRLDGKEIVALPYRLCPDFGPEGYGKGVDVRIPGDAMAKGLRPRARQWQFADLTGDGLDDLVVGIGDWHDYGWDNAFDKTGAWTRGPLHGYVYLAPNVGEKGRPSFANAQRLTADGKENDVYGMPSPCIADFDGDGDLDLICGDFIDKLTYFANTGTTTSPRFAAGRELPFRMHLCMIVPTPVDWDGDGDTDLVTGQEDGRVALVEHLGRTEDGMPQFSPPRFFQQEADRLKFGALATPYAVDWDGDGDEDLVCGNTAGEIALIENLDGGNPPRWAPPRLFEADGQALPRHRWAQRQHPRSGRGQVGLHHGRRRGLGRRRPARHPRQLDLGPRVLVAQSWTQGHDEAGIPASHRGRLARSAAQARLELVGPESERAGDPVAHDAVRHGLEPGWAHGPGHARSRGLPSRLPACAS